MASLTKIIVAQKSCGLVGIDPITSFEDGTAEATALEATYEFIVEDILSHPFRFATKQLGLDREADAPIARWNAAYEIPTDCIAVQAVTVADDTIRFDRYANYIYCDAGEDDSVVLDYTFRENEARWPGFFTYGVQLRLASVLAMSVQERGNVADLMERRAEAHLMKAANRDSSGRTTRKLKLTRITKGRLGRRA